jgi:hypothetical protein
MKPHAGVNMFETTRRRVDLTFNHHREVAGGGDLLRPAAADFLFPHATGEVLDKHADIRA